MGVILLALLFLISVAQANITFKHKNLFPEGFDWDEKRGFFILGSMTSASLYTLSDSGELNLFAHEQDLCEKCGVTGVRVDPPRNRVLAAFHKFDHSSTPFNAVAGFDLNTGKRLFLTQLHGKSELANPIANDIAADPDGNLYVTNSGENFIWKITSGGEEASIFTEHPVLSSQPVRSEDELVRVCGLNGIVYHPDNYLLVGQSNSGALFKVNLRGDEALVVDLKTPIVGADGVAIRGDGALGVVSQSKAWLLRSSDHWRTAAIADELRLDPSGFATAMKFRDGMKMFLLNSHLLELKAGESRSEFSVQQLEFPRDDDDPVWMIILLVIGVLLVLGWRFQMSHFFSEYKRKRF